MMRQTPNPYQLLIICLLGLLVTGCTPADNTPTTSGLPQAPTDVPPAGEVVAPSATAIPTEVTRDFRTIQHFSGVYRLIIPADWEAVDSSSAQRLLVHYIPPRGYGSRVAVDVTNEGPLAPEDVRTLATSYVHLHFVNQPGYAEISRSELPDGRMQYVFLYDDGKGASGRETLHIRQVGPYFSTLRVFLADNDAYYLSGALDTITSSFEIDPLAIWGGELAAINPSELLLVNLSLWRDSEGITYYMGELYNASASDITDVQVRVALCDTSGIVMREVTQPAALDFVAPGGSTPFAASVEGLAAGATVCAQEATANPATPDRNYTTALTLDPTASYSTEGELIIRGRVTNHGLSPVVDIAVIILVYDSETRVIGFEQISYGPGVELAPGDSVQFTHLFPELGAAARRFVTLAQGRVISEWDYSLAPTSEGE